MILLFRKTVKVFLTGWFRLFLIMVVFRVFVLAFGTLFSQTDDFYSYHLFGEQSLSFWIGFIIFSFIPCFILCFIGDCLEKRKNDKK